ncbi:hypothetical protein EZS27_012628 [termite gut metagenome]|uniref:Uncharacterized protein n=1 Tax=termite gut metagenome TaxID=433724 RepID=A0A5J4S1X3_9ZZZZ
MKSFKLIGLVVAFLIPVGLLAQENYKPVDLSIQLKSTHLWRGYEVSSSPILDATVAYKDRSGALEIGLWGASAFQGDYREFDYYISYAVKGFSVSLWDIYNLAADESYGKGKPSNSKLNIFNYDPKKGTSHFIDLSLGYTLQGSYPLNVTWSTILYGRDLNLKYVDETKKETKKDTQAFSTYLAGTFPLPFLSAGGVDFNAGIAAAFTLNPGDEDYNFYAGDRNFGIVNFNLSASKAVTIGGHTYPISTYAMWNPVNKNASLQLAINLF